MVYRVVSTKLTEDQNTALLDECNRQGSTPSNFVRMAIVDKLQSGQEDNATGHSTGRGSGQSRQLTALEKLMASHRKKQ